MVYKKIKCLILNFLWEGKPSKIAYDTIIGKVEGGGLGLLDPLIRMKSIRIKKIKKYWNEEKYAWKDVMRFFLNKCGQIGDDILWMKLKEYMMNGIPEYYKEVLKAWGDYNKHVVCTSLNKDEILRQPLFLNKLLKKGENTIFF